MEGAAAASASYRGVAGNLGSWMAFSCRSRVNGGGFPHARRTFAPLRGRRDAIGPDFHEDGLY
jgi:hypothetical protein